MKGYKKIVLGGLLALGIGFAAVTTTLYINGNVSLKPDEQGFEDNVIFTEAYFDDEDRGDVEILDNGKRIEFTIDNMNTVGDSVTLNYTVYNESYYIAELGELTCEEAGGGTNEYIELDNGDYSDSEYQVELWPYGETTQDLTINMVKSYTSDQALTVTYNCTLPVNARINN